MPDSEELCRWSEPGNEHVGSDTRSTQHSLALEMEDEERLAELFAPDAEVRLTSPEMVFRGREEIRHVLRTLAPLRVLLAHVDRANGSAQIRSLTLGPAAGQERAGRTPGAGDASAAPRRAFGPSAQLFGAALLSLATAVSTLIGALIIFFPELRREPPAALGATLANVALEERAVPTQAGLANLISYEVEFVGYKRKRGYIKYAVFDAATGRRIDPPLSPDPEAPHYYPVGPVIPEAPNDRASANFPVPIPRQAQCVFVRVYAFEEDDATTRLDFADTPPFDTHSATNRACAGLLPTSPAS
ncbi:MAG: hypothetical protein KatS3mg059_1013 [Thermomicrobiales bacterium]|nr:MAG: hypothetical protein KatS3mg059_1013 [Thermomicrobiales bacterium]